MRPAILFIVTCALWTTAPPSFAQLYKWVDDQGVVNYGDLPPWGVKLQPITHGTVSSVADRAGMAAPARTPSASRNVARAAGPASNGSGELPASSASTASVEGTYGPYYGYARRPVVVEAAAERRPANEPIAKPMLPIDAIPEMPRPRR